MRSDLIALYNVKIVARVMELVDVADSKSAAARRAGSSPASGTRIVVEKALTSVGAFFISALLFTPNFLLRVFWRRDWPRVFFAC